MTDPQILETVFANLAWYRRTKDLVHLFENCLLNILVQLLGGQALRTNLVRLYFFHLFLSLVVFV